MKVGIPREILGRERRVAAVPDTVATLVQAGLDVSVGQGAGEGAWITDAQYEQAGATIEPQVAALLGRADVVLKVQAPCFDDKAGVHEVEMMREGALLVTFLQPMSHLELVKRLVARQVTCFSMDCLPRITRAQGMDALTSMSTIAGYKSVIMAAHALGKFFPMLMTAAGTMPPAKVLIVGAGVAGLQAIATARRLGAVVKAFDTRPAVKEEVKSLGADFIDLDLEDVPTEGKGGYAAALTEEVASKERAVLHRQIKDADIVITTALIPGKPAPLLITQEMVQDMRTGSVIVDLAAEAGGNCALSEPGQEVVVHGVSILAPMNIQSSMPFHASRMYAKNVSRALLHLYDQEQKALRLDFEDEITRSAVLTHHGAIRHPEAKEAVEKGG